VILVINGAQVTHVERRLFQCGTFTSFTTIHGAHFHSVCFIYETLFFSLKADYYSTYASTPGFKNF